jgi:hypothetical protein
MRFDKGLRPTGYVKGNVYAFCIVEMNYIVKNFNGKCKLGMQNRWEEIEYVVCIFCLLCIFFLLLLTCGSH